jgi:hypothetical protein
MQEVTRQTKITFGEMRSSGARGVLVYCSDYKCSHSTAINADQWSNDVRLSDIEPRFTCQDFGRKEAARRTTIFRTIEGTLPRSPKIGYEA